MDEEIKSRNNKGMSRSEFLKAIGSAIFFAGLYSMHGMMALADS